VFAHNDPNDLEDILKWAGARTPKSQVLIVTESVFSMDGDQAPMRALVDLKDKYGAWLMVDEAHAAGLFGKNRRGLAEEAGVSDRIEIQMGTLGKAVGSAGGYICGSRVLIDFLVNRARSFIFSTAPPPPPRSPAFGSSNRKRAQTAADRCGGWFPNAPRASDFKPQTPPAPSSQS
jgi:glycine C-acetyltransferase/8-amino-7-oxononanoate synthase